MELRFEKPNLLGAIQLLQGAVGRSTEVPILSNILIGANKQIQLTATDLEISLETDVEGEILASGSITIPGRRLFEIVRQLPLSTVRIITHDKNRVEVRCESGRYIFIGLEADDFPKVASMPKELFSIETRVFQDGWPKQLLLLQKRKDNIPSMASSCI